MPIDAAIPLGIRPPQPTNPLADIAQIMQLKQAQQLIPLKIQEAQQNAQENTLKLEQFRRQVSDQDNLRKSYAAAVITDPATGLPTTDPMKLTQAMKDNGIADKIPEAIEGLNKVSKSSADLKKLQGDIRAKNAEYAGGLGMAIRANNNDPDFYDQQIRTSVANGDVAPEVGKQLLGQLAQLKQQDPTGTLARQFTQQHADQMIAQAGPAFTTAQSRQQTSAGAAAKLPGELAAQPANLARIQAETKNAEQKAAGEEPIQPAQQQTADIARENAIRAEAAQKEQQRHNIVAERQGGGRLSLEQQRLNQTTGGVQLSASQQAIADKLASGDFNPAQLSRFPDKEALVAGAIAKNPNWSPQTYATKRAFEDPQAKQSQNLGTISRIVGHIGRFEGNSKEMGFAPAYAVGMNLTGEQAKLNEDAHAISSELERLVSGGVGTEGQVQGWMKGLRAPTAAARQQAVDEISQLIGSQYEGMNQTYKTTIGQDLPIEKYVTPAGRAWMKSKGINVVGAAGQPENAAASNFKEGDTATNPQTKQKYKFTGGQWVAQ